VKIRRKSEEKIIDTLDFVILNMANQGYFCFWLFSFRFAACTPSF